MVEMKKRRRSIMKFIEKIRGRGRHFDEEGRNRSAHS